MERWFAVCCKPREELVAQENLLRQGFHVYLPQIQVKRPGWKTYLPKKMAKNAFPYMGITGQKQ